MSDPRIAVEEQLAFMHTVLDDLDRYRRENTALKAQLMDLQDCLKLTDACKDASLTDVANLKAQLTQAQQQTTDDAAMIARLEGEVKRIREISDTWKGDAHSMLAEVEALRESLVVKSDANGVLMDAEFNTRLEVEALRHACETLRLELLDERQKVLDAEEYELHKQWQVDSFTKIDAQAWTEKHWQYLRNWCAARKTNEPKKETQQET